MRLGWKKSTVGEMCTLMTGGTPQSSERSYYEGGDINWVVSGDVHRKQIWDCEKKITKLGMANSNARMLPKDSVLIALNGIGKTRGTVAMLRVEATCNQSIVCMSPKDRSALSAEFMFHFLDGQYRAIRNITGDKDRRGLNMPLIRSIEIPIPPLSEQQRIVAILDEAFAGLATATANAEKNLRNARELFESTLNSIFTKRGEVWVERRLDELGRLQTGTTPKTSEPGNAGKFIPFIKPGDFRADGSLDYENEGLSQKGLQSSRLIPTNSAAMVCIGATIGKSGYVERDVAANQQINAITPGKDISAKFLYYQMISNRFQEAVRSNAGQATLPIISKGKWGALTMAVPPSLDEQLVIVSKLDGLLTTSGSLAQVYATKLDRIVDLKQSILQKAFSGELTSPPSQAIKEAAE